MPKIIQNAIYIPHTDTYYKSSHTHDYISIEEPGYGTIDIDGGNDCINRGGDLMKRWWCEYSIYDDASIDKIHNMLLWGTRGPSGNQKLTYRPIRTLELDHLQAILDNCPDIGLLHREVVEYWITKKVYPAKKKNGRKTAYYAHPMSLYGSVLEAKDILHLEKSGFDVINPSDSPYADLTMEQYMELARTCDVVFFRCLPDQKITSGVALELAAARKVNIPIYEIAWLPQLKFRTLSRNETRVRMGMKPLRTI